MPAPAGVGLELAPRASPVTHRQAAHAADERVPPLTGDALRLVGVSANLHQDGQPLLVAQRAKIPTRCPVLPDEVAPGPTADELPRDKLAASFPRDGELHPSVDGGSPALPLSDLNGTGEGGRVGTRRGWTPRREVGAART